MPLRGDYQPSSVKIVREQVEQYESSGGTRGTTMGGRPVVILTTVGARTGGLRKTPLMRVEYDGDYAVVASMGGAPQHPLWYFNLVANPHVELQDGPVRQDMTARALSGDERALWWERAVAAFPTYAGYERKTRRVIPVVALEPVDPN